MMSNFGNSRFAALLDDEADFVEVKAKKRTPYNGTETEGKVNKDNGHANNAFKDVRRHRPSRRHDTVGNEFNGEDEKVIKEFEEKTKEKRVQESLKLDYFPSLGETKQPLKQKQGETFLDKLRNAKTQSKTKSQTDENDPDMLNVRPGCVVLKRDPVTRKTIIKGLEEEEVKAEQDDPSAEFRNVLTALATLYKKRTQAYIAQNGYDIWEKLYRFPNYNYDSFDRQDKEFYQQEHDSDSDPYESEDSCGYNY